MSQAARAFEGLRVIDVTHVLAGPACTYYLALLGAEVIKVEEPLTGDTVRNRGGNSPELLAAQMGTHYLAQNANKKSLVVDLKTPAGQRVIKELAATADVFVENYRAEALPKLGLGAAELQKLNPRLIYCSVSGYGHTGPKADVTAYDVNIQAASGLMSLTGTPEVSPLRTGAPILDYATGLAAAFAVSAALLERERTGRGQTIDVAMLDTALALMSSVVTDTLTTGIKPKPRGNETNSAQPTSGSFETKEGLLSLGVNEEHQFARLARVLGKQHWLEDERFASRDSRAQHAGEIRKELEVTLLERSAEAWQTTLQDAGVPAARVRALQEALTDEQIRSRGYLETLGTVAGERVTVALAPFRFATAGPRLDRAPPYLGEDTEAVLLGLGYSRGQIENLIATGVVSCYRPAES